VGDLFQEAKKVTKRFKISAYGAPGSGKTLFGLSFPKAGVVDMEHGTDWYAGRDVVSGLGIGRDFMVKHTKSAKEVIKFIDDLENRLRDDPGYIETLVIDPITLFWEAVQDAFLTRLQKKKGDDVEIMFHHWKKIKGPYLRLMTKLINLPVHLVLLGRESSIYDKNNKGELIVTGTKISAEKDTPYISDMHLRFFTKPHPETGEDVFFAKVEKDRTNILKKGTIIKNCSFKKLVELSNGIVNMDEVAVPSSSEPDEPISVAEKDMEIFDDEVKQEATATAKGDSLKDIDAIARELIKDDDIVSLRKKLEWSPAKVRAVIVREGFKTREEIGKYLADKVRDGSKSKEK